MLSLAQHKVDILKCRGQAYDGAAAMSSERVGVQDFFGLKLGLGF